jgi:hypothetical protein
MMKNFILKLFIFLIFSKSPYLVADVIKESKIQFNVHETSGNSKDIHYFFKILSPKKLATLYPDLTPLDSLKLFKRSGSAYLLTKSVMEVKKPFGFFNQEVIVSSKYLKSLEGAKEVQTMGSGEFKIFQPENSYKLKIFFDGDDISTSNNQTIRAITALKKFDVLTQASSNTMMVEKTQFEQGTHGGIEISSFIPVKKNSTLVITYALWSISKDQFHPDLEKNFKNELEAKRYLVENHTSD